MSMLSFVQLFVTLHKRSSYDSTQEQLRGAHHLRGKEQWLLFAGAAFKRYPTSKVRETEVRW